MRGCIRESSNHSRSFEARRSVCACWAGVASVLVPNENDRREAEAKAQAEAEAKAKEEAAAEAEAAAAVKEEKARKAAAAEEQRRRKEAAAAEERKKMEAEEAGKRKEKESRNQTQEVEKEKKERPTDPFDGNDYQRKWNRISCVWHFFDFETRRWVKQEGKDVKGSGAVPGRFRDGFREVPGGLGMGCGSFGAEPVPPDGFLEVPEPVPGWVPEGSGFREVAARFRDGFREVPVLFRDAFRKVSGGSELPARFRGVPGGSGAVPECSGRQRLTWKHWVGFAYPLHVSLAFDNKRPGRGVGREWASARAALPTIKWDPMANNGRSRTQPG
ncbi:hypothetical protein AK812_SmicGene37209 [Symbiodinium microadriaticum]|uniref:Reticulocyte-binding protein 2-like a n=1 Tax=Symbiodinium microadriaticum TaxID=2951 RepID=A0A1Q9CGV3_SYMMI|nr:hypothetical protein AK812_SmicGene37209 [Symbiodinium microadriaticum]